jgi:hypothetical protein
MRAASKHRPRRRPREKEREKRRQHTKNSEAAEPSLCFGLGPSSIAIAIIVSVIAIVI